MDKYLVKSIKWTEHNGYTTWWGPNRSGYTPLIRQAGIYTEEEAKGLEKSHGNHVCIAVPFDQGLVQLGIQQIEDGIKAEQEEIERYESYIEAGRRRIEQKQQLMKEFKDKHVK